MRLPGCATSSAIRSPSSPRARPSANVPNSAWHMAKLGTGMHGGQDSLTEALAALRPVEGRHGLPAVVDRPTIVALGLIGCAEVEVRQRVQDDIPAGRGERKGALGGGDGLVICPHEAEIDRQRDRDLSQPTRVVEGHCEGFGLAQNRQETPQVAGQLERRAQGEPEIDGLLARVACLRQMREGAERLLEVPHGLAVGRPRQGLLPCLPAVCQGLVPHLAPQGMVRQAFDLLGHPVPDERFEGLDDAGMQHPPPLLEQAAVGHLMGQGVLEGVLVVGKEARLVRGTRPPGGVPGRHAAPPRAARQWPATGARGPPCQ